MNNPDKIFQNSGYLALGVGLAVGSASMTLVSNLSRYLVKKVIWNYSVSVNGEFLQPEAVTNQECKILIRDVANIQTGTPLVRGIGWLGGNAGGIALYNPGEYDLNCTYNNSVVFQVDVINQDFINTCQIWVSLYVIVNLL